MKTLSVVVSAYNEENTIGACLDSVSWADELIVVDNESTDKTAAIAKAKGAIVYKRPNRVMLNTNKNYGFSKATKDWILNLDADERVTSELKKEIQQILQHSSDVSGYDIPRQNIIFGKWIQHGLWWPDYQMRLFQRESGSFPCIHVHEYLEVNGKTKKLHEAMIHENYQTVSQFIRKMDTIYTENEAEQLAIKGYSLERRDIIQFPVRNFISTYYARKGYKDGMHGLALALLQAVYGLVTFLKLWEKEAFVEKSFTKELLETEIRQVNTELRYWNLTQDIEANPMKFGTLTKRIQRKLINRT
jgi:glycosyltransferase involved in cell wall biosynthesis